MKNEELDNKLIELWGNKVKPFNVPPNSRLIENIDFNSLTTKNLITILDILVKSSWSDKSGFSVDSDNYDILDFVRSELNSAHYQSRRINPIRRCYDILFNYNKETEWLFALASMYLIAELEYLLKKDSWYLSIDGTIIKTIPKSLRTKISTSQYKIGKRINQIGDIITIYCYRNNWEFATYLKNYDSTTKAFMKIRLKDAYSEINGKKIPARYHHINLKDRINKSRNQTMHGENPHLIGEIFFYLTLHSIYYLTNKNVYTEY